MQKVFQKIWDSIPPHKRVCYETEKRIYGEISTIYFHHVLPKENFPQYKFSEWNIILVSWETHDQIHLDMDKTPRVKAKYLELLEKYHNFEL